MPRTTLCSYTYNDGDLMHGLLESVSSWSLKPDEIIVLDDGSDEPFSLTEEEKALPVRLVRHENNQGFIRAKHDCIASATGDIILAMDCDARIGADFLERCVLALRDKSVGMLGGQTAPPLTDDYSSWYYYTFSFGSSISKADESVVTEVGKKPQNAVSADVAGMSDTSFVCGGLFALRREVWDEVGGFDGYDKAVHEDTYLSSAVMARGYKLKIINRQFWLLRVFSRESLCRRYWKLGRSSGCVDGVIASGLSLPFTQEGFIQAVRSRCASIEEHELTLVFYYYEILIMCHTFLEFCNEIGTQGKLLKEAGQNLLEGLRRCLAAYPRLGLLLKADLLKLRVLPLSEYLAPAAGDNSDLARKCDWSPVLAVLDDLAKKNILAYLEREGVDLILQDEREVEAHFSGY